MTQDFLDSQNVSRETFDRLKTYAVLLEKWNPRINLVSRNSLADLWTRHIVDSIQVFRAAPKTDTWVDMGSGGGFPGLVIAILAADEMPDCQVTLIESDQRKSAFLRTVARETGVTCRIMAQRIEAVPPQNAGVISARALADLNTLLGFVELHLRQGGIALFPKGVTWQKEVEDARIQWSFDLDPITSLTEPGAAILKVEGVSRV